MRLTKRTLPLLFVFAACASVTGLDSFHTSTDGAGGGVGGGQQGGGGAAPEPCVHDIDLVLNHTCAAVRSGKMYCWGQNGAGQLGIGSTLGSATPELVTMLDNVVDVAVSKTSSFAVLEDGSVWGWGDNSNGQLPGHALTRSEVPVPITMPGDEVIVQVEAGMGHVCARSVSGKVFCWGLNDFGQAGSDIGGIVGAPNEAFLDATALSVGGRNAYVIDSSGDVWGWGRNSDQQLATAPEVQPDAVNLGGPAQWIAAGGAHLCAIDNNKVWCMGWNAHGQLGLAALADVGSPTPLPVVPDASSVYAAGRRTCALTTDGTWCWGESGIAAMMGGAAELIELPKKVGSLGNVDAMALGSYHSCAAFSNKDELRCWGANASGQLGDGTNMERQDPVKVELLCD
jgi:alpha-tubulin suppressor-like RCC1 family protein